MGWVYNASPELSSQSRYPAIIAVCLVLTILMVTIVSLRIYLHARAARLAAADWVILASTVGSFQRFYPCFHSNFQNIRINGSFED